MYYKRSLEKVIHKANAFFPVLLITGPRQVGKTSIFQNCEKNPRTYVSLDTLDNRDLAQNDPALFLQRYPFPVLIDEIQYAPQLFPYIKAIVDKEKQNGMYWLTGSQQFNLMANVSESLAGRVGILKLQGFSQSEKQNIQQNTFQNADPFLPPLEYINRRANRAKSCDVKDIYALIWKGSYPRLYNMGADYLEMFYDSYIQTYIERDVKQLLAIKDEAKFMKFMKAVAARIGQLINYADLANDVGVSQPTIKSWLSILETSGIIYLLKPYSENLTNRVIKTPKLYFMDTGLAAYLCAWKTPETLEVGAMNGAFLESYVISEIIKSYWYNGKNPNMYFYRDKHMKEIDIIIEENGTLYPIEIKKKSNPSFSDVKNFLELEKLNTSSGNKSLLNKSLGEGAIVCLAPTHLPLATAKGKYPNNINIIPISYI